MEVKQDKLSPLKEGENVRVFPIVATVRQTATVCVDYSTSTLSVIASNFAGSLTVHSGTTRIYLGDGSNDRT